MQVVAEERAGTAEEIAAVFVAALRAMGLLVRFVRSDMLLFIKISRRLHFLNSIL